jgi:hypothetical protein
MKNKIEVSSTMRLHGLISVKETPGNISGNCSLRQGDMCYFCNAVSGA